MKPLKICIYVLLGLSLIAFILTFLVSSKRENEKALRIEAESKVAKLLQEKERVAQAYETAKDDLSTAQTELERETRRARELEQELVIERRDKEKLTGQVAVLSGDLESLNRDYEDVQAKYEDLARVVKRLKQKFEVFKNRRSNEPVELPTVVVKPQEALEGRVLVVNDVFRFVVVNLGREDGLAEGMILDVMGEGGARGRVEVERLYDSLAACSIRRESQGMTIRVHDMVRTV